jgi:Glycosyl hydrolases family 16
LFNTRAHTRKYSIDVRHMPAGCGVWPAFWLTDEANWPLNGEIDIVEGVNYQSVAKTALHSTKGCSMYDIPLGTMTGEWDTAQGIPDKKTGVPDMTLRYAQNCFVYDPHQWLNQGCVAVDKLGDTLGQPVNANGGGVYVLEWDPINRHIRTWVFTPYSNVPINLAEAIRTANLPQDDRIVPDPNLWPIPYGYFAIGEGTDCPAFHFRHMRLVLNTAFCGSVSGNRFFLDCPVQVKNNFTTCNDWVKSNPPEMDEAYWKIRGVYVYQREWRSTWLY